MLMVRVVLRDPQSGTPTGESAVGVLVDTQLIPVQGPQKVSMNARGELVQNQGQGMMLQGFGVVATDRGFIVAPLSDVTPIFEPEKEGADAQAEDAKADVRP
jgi:hypothetical protein